MSKNEFIINGSSPITPLTDEQINNHESACGHIGLTKREYFAGLAMQGLSAGDIENMYTCDDIAGIAVVQADALLKELDK